MEQICQMSQGKLLKTLKTFLKKKDYNLIVTDSYIIAEGQLPVCLMAHLDTVGSAPPNEIYYDQKKKVMWSPDLLGADDRAGVYAIIQIIEHGYRPHIIFTTNEELGAVGASTLVSENPDCPLENLSAIFELDRRGYNDCVFYDCDNKHFTKFVEGFGFKTAYGSFSDISVIAPAWGVAAANLSIGYENEHMQIEILHVKWLEKTIKKVEKILDYCIENELPYYTYIERKKPIINYCNPYDTNERLCFICNKVSSDFHNLDFHRFKTTSGQYYDICDDCYKKYY